MSRRTSVFTVVVAVAMMMSGVAWAAGHQAPSITNSESVYWFADDSDTGGTSHLTRTAGMVLATVEAEGLEKSNAYTLWWVVFNNPGACSDGICGEDDIFNANGTLNEAGVVAAQIGVGNATGNVAKADGTAEFGARLKRNDSSGAHQIVFPAGLSGNALLTANPGNAEIHLVVQSHGRARSGPALLQQLTYLEANCTPTCEDVQFAVHLP